jgi:ribosomal peptide maturation radical SAM protein 1
MNSIPVPNFSNFFEDIQKLSDDHKVDIKVNHLPVENSRGCWWGAKSHCVFCGIRDDDLVFRAKDAGNVLKTLEQLSNEYGIHSFRFSDYILPYQYFKTLLPDLALCKPKYELISEMKSNMNSERFRLLADAGFKEVQPGIESFNTQVLKNMAKGVSAIQNIHTILLGKQHGIRIHYNLLYGFPDDNKKEYQRLVCILPHLKHLDPPSTRLKVQVTRYAPFQTNPERFGIGIAHYEPSYEIIFSGDYLRESKFDLDQFCYYFDRPYQNSIHLERLYECIDTIVDAWKEEQRTRHVFLYSLRIGDLMEIHDGRVIPEKIIMLDNHMSHIINMCSDPISERQLLDHNRKEIGIIELKHILDKLEEKGFLFRDGELVISLVIPATISSDTQNVNESTTSSNMFEINSSKSTITV